jgi:hypothetical protein
MRKRKWVWHPSHSRHCSYVHQSERIGTRRVVARPNPASRKKRQSATITRGASINSINLTVSAIFSLPSAYATIAIINLLACTTRRLYSVPQRKEEERKRKGQTRENLSGAAPFSPLYGGGEWR